MKRSRAHGWGVFAATLLFVVGAVNIVQSLVAMFMPAYFVGAEDEILVWDFAVWGLLLGVWGVVLVVAGFALLTGHTWARVFTVVVAAVNAFAQLAFIGSYPVWSLVAIAVDVLVIYAVTAGWPDRLTADDGAYAAGRADAERARAGADQGAGGGGHGADADADERSYGGASSQEAREGTAERPPGTRPGKHEQPMS
ncbi:DUF7144 family membrane protein [Streptomonospora wellingtoniae]|uniref:DUF7144 domain-containing protein n=1 Tax=Streptomonospora wellingtoniae TaxID=3075544 RepID=A0ABU2KUP9_9ACTN|nr:hypothetical protein [Streptomonospora sp. DSM 45055]MDT0303009.1 hypothetical protein [Streptomonospora sp. DSM 45055]